MLLKRFLNIFVCIFLQTVKQTSCDGGITLSFVIDDSRSMRNDIHQVNKEAKSIMNIVLTKKSCEIKDMVIVTVNDPDVILRTKTKSPDKFLQHLKKIRAHYFGNTDCEEMTLTGIEKALLASRPNSYIYVFTDASAKDYYKLNKIKALCQKKQSQVVFVLSGDCGYPSSPMFTVYYDVAKACSGQVFRVHKNQVSSVLKTIEILLEGKHSIFKWEIVPRTATYIPVTFKLDEKSEYALVSSSGKNVELRITKINNIWDSVPPHVVTMWNDNGKVVKLVNPEPGTYYAWVKGDSTVSVVVHGRTDFTFEYGFSNLEPKSMSDTSKQPIAGFKQHASIIVTNSDNSIDIKTLQVLDINNKDNVIAELPLRKTGDNVYITDSFISPNYTFKIAVKGVIKATREPIIRNSKNIEPQILDPIPETIPIVNITEGIRIDVSYGSKVTLTCDVIAHPAPKIEWYTSSGVLLASESSVIEDPKFVSYLKLDNIKINETYVCKASNKIGGREKSIKVEILLIFTNNNVPKGTDHNVKLGEDVKIPCNITSYMPIHIKWFKAGKELSPYSEKHSISPDGFELTLKSMNIDMQGAYTCEAFLSYDHNIKETHNMEVKIPGLESPVINNKETIYYGAEGDIVMKIPCNVTGFPKPTIVWKKEGKDLRMDSKFSINGTTLYVHNPTQSDSNKYTCIVTNVIGTDTKTFSVQVIDPIPKSVPKVNIQEGTKMVIHYGSKVALTCDVTAHPTPKIEWYTSSGVLLASENSVIKDPKFVSHLKLENIKNNETYVCKASNEIGIGQDQSFKIEILSIFTNTKVPKGTDHNVKLGEDVKIPCNITSYMPIHIKWFKAGKELSPYSEKHSISPDGFELTLKSMNIDMQGAYTCEASLSYDHNIKETHNTEVKIPGLESPVINNKKTIYYGAEGDIVMKIPCNVTGFPKPTIVWKKEGNDLRMDSKFSINGTTLYVHNPTQSDSNKYTCIVTNVIGTDTKTFSVQVIDPIPKSVPKVKIQEGTKMVIHYGSKVALTCDVTAHPTPKIEWYTSSGVLLASENSVIKDPKFVSHLKLENIKNNETYVCKASNEIGIGQDKSFKIEILSIFTNNNVPKGTDYNVKLGEDVKIPCNITSYMPIHINWFKAEKELSRHSEKHSLSPDGFELTLKSMSIDLQGAYTCEASLSSDRNIKETHNTEVKIPGLESPVINNKETIYYGTEGDIVMKIPCNVTGFPKPTIVWKKEGKDLRMDSKFSINGTTLYVHNPTQSDSNKYTCIVTNVIGTDTKTFSVQVIDPIPKSVPKVNIQEGTKMVIYYGSKVALTCDVTAHPTPKIEWYTSSGVLLASENSVIKDPKFVSHLKLENIKNNETYVCKASNEIGIGQDQSFKIEILSIFTNTKVPKGTDHNVKLGEDVKIPCNITSYMPIHIKWFKAGKELSPYSEKHSISPDGFELTLKSMNIDMQGAYTCEAFLSYDHNIKETHNMEVKIPGLESPVINNKETIYYGAEGDIVMKIPCNVTGFPKPTIVWKKEGKDLRMDSKFSINGTTLYVHNPTQSDSNKYTCIVTNVIGTDTKTFSVQVIDLIPKSVPKVNIQEGMKMDVNYGSKVSLTCDVTAHPAPKIEWYSSSGVLLASESSVIKDPIYVSYLKLENITHNETYVCKALNKIGRGEVKAIQIYVRPVFTNNSIPKEAGYNVEFGNDVKIPCNITSYLPIQIKWFKAGNELSDRLEEYSISPDRFELTLKTMKIAMQETYSCEASLISDPTVKVKHNTEVKIPGLALPKIQPLKRNIHLMKQEKLEINCTTIQGYPKPHIKWSKKYANRYNALSDVENVEVLTAHVGLFKYAGQYKCIATNEIGSDFAFFEVTISSRPEITITDTNRNIPYNSSAEFNCKVEAYPTPSIVWKDGNGSIVQSKVSQVSEYEFVSHMELHNVRKNDVYICEAINKVGSKTNYVNLTVSSPFKVKDHIHGSVGIYYGSADTLLCDIKSDIPMKVRWLIQNKDVLSMSHKYSTSDDGTQLTVKSMDLDMAGKYTCEAYLISDPTEKVAFSADVSVVGLVVPEVISSTTLLDEKNFTAICRIKGIPTPVISWKFQPKGAKDFRNIQGSKEELNIPEIKLNHSGVYKCIAKNILGETQRDFKLVVEERPVINNEETTYYGVERDSVIKIPCNVTGFPDPTITWKRGDKTLNFDSKFAIKGTTLYINDPVQSDTNVYSCEATNKLGTATKEFFVEIVDNFEGDDKFNGNSYNVLAERDKPMSIKCNMSSSDTMRWYKDGSLTKQTGSSFTIERVSYEDEGNYTCRVNTDEGPKSETYTIHVGYPPIFDDDTPLITIEWQDNAQKLDCSANAEPSAEYEWIHNGKIIQSGVDLYERTITDLGEYTCNVSNVYGYIKKSFNIIAVGRW